MPQGVTVEDATHGVSVPRNKLLFSNGIHLLPYTGAGSGLTRAQLYTPNIKFENDERLKEFVVTIWSLLFLISPIVLSRNIVRNKIMLLEHYVLGA